MSTDANSPKHKFTIVVGCGISGIILGAEAYRQKVIQHAGEILMIDKNGGFGGVWWANTYPGAACDVVSHIYSISWFPRPDWNRRYSLQSEIFQYYTEVAHHYSLEKSAIFNTTVLSAQWSDTELLWTVVVRNDKSGEIHYYTANVLVSAVGQLNRARITDIPGRESFMGHQFHTAEWKHSVDLTGKRVAVIGTGPSAGQAIPEIAKVAGHVTVYQRSPPHVFPRDDYTFPEAVKWGFKWIPFVRWFHRFWLYYQQEMTPYKSVHISASENAQAAALCQHHLHKQIPASRQDLRKKLTPSYKFGCKRPLFLDNYYPTFLRENVSLETSRIQNITTDSIISNSGENTVDVIIWATGFVTQDFLGHIDVRGTNGKSLKSQWGETAQAYLGIGVHNFPNLLFQYGPATGLLWGSLVFMFETQALYNCQVMKRVSKIHQRGDRVAYSPKREVEERYNVEIQEKMKQLAFSDNACSSFYKNSEGVVTTNFPWRLADYWRRLWRVNWSAYERFSKTAA